jgi:hypothetical protein
MINIAVSILVGAGLGVALTFGGVQAVTGADQTPSNEQLLTYSDD